MVPIWLIVTTAALLFIMTLLTIGMFFAWKGMELMYRELQQRLAIVQVDVTGLMQPLRPRDGRFRLDDARTDR